MAKPSRAVAVVSGSKAVGKAQFAGALSNMRREKLIMPRLGLAQSKSPIVEDLGQAKAGDFFNSLTNEVLGASVKVVVITGSFSRAKWIPQADGGGIECSARDGMTGTVHGSCDRCPHARWTQNKKGEDRPPACTESDNFFVLVRGADTPMTLSFSKSSAKAGNKLRTILTAEETNGRAPWMKAYSLTTSPASYAAGKCHVIGIAIAGESTEDEQALAEKWFNTTRKKSIDLGEAAEQAGDDHAVEAEEEVQVAPRTNGRGARVAQKARR